MRKTRNTLVAGLALAAGLASAGMLYAQDDAKGSSGMDGEMMKGKDGHMMGGMHGNMMGMMNQMNSMMEKCNAMMDRMEEKQGAEDKQKG